jgi:hypothetical protein
MLLLRSLLNNETVTFIAVPLFISADASFHTALCIQKCVVVRIKVIVFYPILLVIFPVLCDTMPWFSQLIYTHLRCQSTECYSHDHLGCDTVMW